MFSMAGHLTKSLSIFSVHPVFTPSPFLSKKKLATLKYCTHGQSTDLHLVPLYRWLCSEVCIKHKGRLAWSKVYTCAMGNQHIRLKSGCIPGPQGIQLERRELRFIGTCRCLSAIFSRGKNPSKMWLLIRKSPSGANDGDHLLLR